MRTDFPAIGKEIGAVKASEIQIAGNHYKNFKIQPAEFSTKNKLGFLQGCIVKRICRYNLPTGKGLQDLQKIKHEVDLLIEFEGWREIPETQDAKEGRR